MNPSIECNIDFVSYAVLHFGRSVSTTMEAAKEAAGAAMRAAIEGREAVGVATPVVGR